MTSCGRFLACSQALRLLDCAEVAESLIRFDPANTACQVCSLLAAYWSLLTTRCLHLTARSSLLTAHCSLPTALISLLIAYRVPVTAY